MPQLFIFAMEEPGKVLQKTVFSLKVKRRQKIARQKSVLSWKRKLIKIMLQKFFNLIFEPGSGTCEVVESKIIFSTAIPPSLKARFHYERGKEHSLFLLLIFD